MGVMYEAVQNGVCISWIADDGMPARNRKLRSDFYGDINRLLDLSNDQNTSCSELGRRRQFQFGMSQLNLGANSRKLSTIV